MNQLQLQVLTWLANGRTGLSSETLAFWTAFGVRKDGVNYPSDPADFNRCLMLLAAAPGLRDELHKMSGLSPEWGRLVARWAEVEESLLAEVGLNWSKGQRLSATKTYALMKTILDEKRGTVRIVV